jgi:RNA polymerase sigma factor for flagellar operon FliA
MTTSPACRTSEEREQLILEHIQQVQWIASRMHERLPETVLQEDLISAGMLGLIAAVDKYDPSRNASLKTYAEHKIRGAILDSIRALDNVPAHRRRRAKLVQSAIEAAQRRSTDMPDDGDIAREVNLTVEEYREALGDLRRPPIATLDSGANDGPDASPLRYISDRSESSPGSIAERAALQRLLVQAITYLPKVERTIIGLYFTEELSLAEIGQVLHIHTSRVSQLKLQAVLRLRSYMKKKWPAGRAS